jgi:putative transposase
MQRTSPAVDLHHVSRPRRICPDETVMKQKRCLRREFRLRPDRLVVQIILYTLAYTANKYGILLHDFCVLSNHDHIAATDPEAKRPRFTQLFHSLVARAINATFGEWDALWSTQPYSAPRLLEPDDVLRKLVYVLANPVAAGLVRYCKDWAGPTSWNMEYGVPIKIARPPVFFSKKMPEEVELVIHRPPGLRPDLGDRELRALVRERARAKEREIIGKMAESGRTFMGMARVLKQGRHDTPSTPDERGGIRPTVAGRSKWARIEALQQNARFLVEHEAARRAFVAGSRDVVFPYGTYLMRVRYGCACASP